MLTIPAGTQTGKQFRLKEKGVKNVHGYGHGDLFVNIKVVTPNKLTDRQKELMRELRKSVVKIRKNNLLILKTKLVNSLEVNNHELDRICSHCKS